MEERHFFAQLKQKKKIAEDLLELHFTRPSDFSFLAGQFVQFEIPFEDRLVRRSYSVASAPHDSSLEFCVKLFPGGVGSEYFSRIEAGTQSSFLGPRGNFFVNREAEGYFFVATGAGLAPIMAMLRDEVEVRKTEKEFRLLFGVRTEEDLFWVERLDQLKAQSSLFSYQITLSQPKSNGGWHGLTGRVTDHLLHHLIHHHYYLCGSAAMVKDVRAMLLEEGIPASRIHFEIF